MKNVSMFERSACTICERKKMRANFAFYEIFYARLKSPALFLYSKLRRNFFGLLRFYATYQSPSPPAYTYDFILTKFGCHSNASLCIYTRRKKSSVRARKSF